MSDEMRQFQRASFWTSVVAAQVGFAHHPGTTRDTARPRSRNDILSEADAYLAEFDRRFTTEEPPCPD